MFNINIFDYISNRYVEKDKTAIRHKFQINSRKILKITELFLDFTKEENLAGNIFY